MLWLAAGSEAKAAAEFGSRPLHKLRLFTNNRSIHFLDT